MDILAQSLASLLDFWNLAMLATGVVVGVSVGAIPGLTATMAVALALPFTFAMTPIASILLLVGIYKGGLYAGSITAILINTPGTPAAAATTMDGYPLARQGQARKALEIALYSSCLADLVSNIALLVFAAQLARLAGAFGPPEYFWLIAFSLTVVITVSGRSLTRGLVSAVIGLLLSTVGLDLVYGTQRFMFDDYHLADGLNIVPLLIGLFAIPEVIAFYGNPGRPLHVTSASGKGLSLPEFRRCLPAILKGSLIGVVVGALPGTGATPAAFVAYGEARRASPRRANFGKGELEGVAAAEAGNNGTAGATLIPLLALGIPGDVVTAVMLGAFMIHGLTPGPLLFQDNIVFVYALFLGIMASSLFLFLVGKGAIRVFAKVSDIPSHMLVPIVLLFCIWGAFAVANSWFDVGVMAAAGLLGALMLRFSIPLPPLVIGLVLGNLLEDNFRRTLLLGRGEAAIFFESWLSWLFIGLALLSLIIGLVQHRLDARRREAAQA